MSQCEVFVQHLLEILQSALLSEGLFVYKESAQSLTSGIVKSRRVRQTGQLHHETTINPGV